MIKWDLSQPSKMWKYVIYHSNKLRESHMITSIDTEKAPGKMQSMPIYDKHFQQIKNIGGLPQPDVEYP